MINDNSNIGIAMVLTDIIIATFQVGYIYLNAIKQYPIVKI
jgi:hypothetical protein